MQHAAPVAARRQRTVRPPLWDREEASGAATDLLGRARAGAGGTLFLVGAAGLGKSTFMDNVVDLAAPDIRVARAQGDRMETMLPLGVISQLVDRLEDPDRPYLAGAARMDWSRAASNSYAALRWLASVAVTPVLIAVDDLHWSDAESLALLSFLCRRVARLPVAVVATLRRWPPVAEEMCMHLVGRGHAHLERLSPLSLPSSARLLAEVSGRRPPNRNARDLWLACGGNPLLLRLAAEGRSSAPASLTKEPRLRGRSSDDLILDRFACLPAPARRCADAASLLGAQFELDVAAEAAELTPDQARAAIEALCRSGLVVESPRGASEFAQPVVRRALQDALPGPVRQRLLQRILRALSVPASAAASERPSGATREAAKDHPAHRLTSQERRVARLAAAGLSNQDIATGLYVSINTIETHLKRIYPKLGVSSRRQLMTMSTSGTDPGF